MSIHLICATLRSLGSRVAWIVGLGAAAGPLDPIERLQHDGAGESVTIEFCRLGW
jgi:hypothetical protein